VANTKRGFANKNSSTLFEVFRCLMEHGEPLSTLEIAERIGKTHSAVANTLLGNEDVFVRYARVRRNAPKARKSTILWTAWEE
jgi:hypothetical protein